MQSKTDGVANEYWIWLLIREWVEIGIFFYIGYVSCNSILWMRLKKKFIDEAKLYQNFLLFSIYLEAGHSDLGMSHLSSL